MKVLRDGKEVKNAEVIYDTTGRADSVRIDGVYYDINAFELVDTKAKEKTKEDLPVRDTDELESRADPVETPEDMEDTPVDTTGSEPKHKTLFGRKKK